MEDMFTYITATDLKRRVAEILNLVYYEGRTAIVERYGKSLVKIVPFKENETENMDRKKLAEKYFGILPDFPDVTKMRKFKKHKLVFS